MALIILPDDNVECHSRAAALFRRYVSRTHDWLKQKRWLFILSTDVPAGSEDDPAFFNARVAAYRERLESLRDKLPSSAYEFAMADSHYDPSSHQCPHDSWVESLTISEPYSGARRERRSIEISLRLPGAYHDGHIELTYRDVKSYSLETPAEFRMPPLDAGHGDWLTDEIRLSPGRARDS